MGSPAYLCPSHIFGHALCQWWRRAPFKATRSCRLLDNVFFFLSLVLTVSCWINWHAYFSVCTHYLCLLKAEKDLHLQDLEKLVELHFKAFGWFLTLCHVWLFFWQPSILKPGSYGNAFTPLALLLDSPSLLSSVCLSLTLVHSSVAQHAVGISSPPRNRIIFKHLVLHHLCLF